MQESRNAEKQRTVCVTMAVIKMVQQAAGYPAAFDTKHTEIHYDKNKNTNQKGGKEQ